MYDIVAGAISGKRGFAAEPKSMRNRSEQKGAQRSTCRFEDEDNSKLGDYFYDDE